MGRRSHVKRLLTLTALLLPATPLFAQEETGVDAEEPLVLQRIEAQRNAAEGDFSILAHKPTWIMPITWQETPNQAPWADTERDITRLEAVFQISLKVPVLWQLWSRDATLWAGYTQRAWWQAYNAPDSRPFRETNHEPEVFIDWMTDWNYLGMEQRMLRFGISHLSNGRPKPLSRTYNRIYAAFIYEFGDVAVAIRPWYEIKEPAEESDNPDIERYMGNFDLTGVWKRGKHEYSVLIRNNLRFDDNRGAAQVDWSFPLHGKVRGYVQLFNGYGESLIDYDESITRVGFGVLLSGWL